MIENITRTLPEVAYFMPGQNAHREGIENWLPHLQDRPFTDAVAKVRAVVGEDWDKSWAKPVILLGVTAGVAATFSWYLKSRPGAHSGLSMGEKAAMVSAGILGLDPALVAMKTRGQRLEELSDPKAKLAAVVGMGIADIEQRVVQANDEGIPVDLANKNAPEQGVIGLLPEHTDAVKKIFKGARVILLNGVSYAMHTRFVEDASEMFKLDLQELIKLEDLRPSLGNVFSPMRVARGLDPVIRSALDAYDVLFHQVRSPLDNPTSLEALVNTGVKDIVVFDQTEIASKLVQACVGSRVTVHSIKNREDVINGIQTIAGKYNLTDIRDPQELVA